MIIHGVVFGLAALLSLQVAENQSPQPSSQEQQNSQKATTDAQEDDPVVCRRINTTGTRTGGERICRTRSEWNKAAPHSR
jgi:hypothetical protein